MGVTQTGPYRWKVSTDEKHVIVVDSILVSNEWEKSATYAGQKAFYQIYTAFVGYASPITVRCKTASGKTLSDEVKFVYNNYLRDAFDLPDDLEEGETLYLEVESVKKKLYGSSKPIPVYRKPYVKNLKWDKEKVDIGDVLTLTAEAYNVNNDTPALITVYEFWDNFGQSVTKIPTLVQDNKVEILFEFRCSNYKEKVLTNYQMNVDKDGFYPLRYFFTVTIGSTEYGREKQESGFIEFNNKWVEILEFEDKLFQENGAVLLPDRVDIDSPNSLSSTKITGVSSVAAALLFATQKKGRPMILLGHSGKQAPDKVSLERATGIVHLIADDKEEWVKWAHRFATNKEMQHFLKWSGYDPGAIDGVIGPQTTSRIKAFQKKSGLKDDGEVGPKTWGAFYDLFQSRLKSHMSTIENGKLALENRKSVKWLYADKKASCCGENFPKAGFDSFVFRSETDARVEALFFLPDQAPKSCECKDGKCKKDKCSIFDAKKGYRRQLINPLDEAYQPPYRYRYSV